jgi:hypothetical protein
MEKDIILTMFLLLHFGKHVTIQLNAAQTIYNCHHSCVLCIIEKSVIFVNSENMFKINVKIFRPACIHPFPDRSCIRKNLRIFSSSVSLVMK